MGFNHQQPKPKPRTLTIMSEEKSKTNLIGAAIKGIHRRMSSMGSSSKS
jgi:hypothetical protein